MRSRVALAFVLSLGILAAEHGWAIADEPPADRHCALFSKVQQTLAARVGGAVDALTRLAGIEVACEAKSIVFRQQVNLQSRDLQPDWISRRERRWSATYCRGTRDYADAIRAGWTIATVLSLADGREIRLSADCSDAVA